MRNIDEELAWHVEHKDCSDTELSVVPATKSRNNDNGNPWQGESKCGNLQSLVRRSPPPFVRISHPRNRCPLASWFSPDPPPPFSWITIASPHHGFVSMMPRARFNLFSSPPRVPHDRALPPLLLLLAIPTGTQFPDPSVPEHCMRMRPPRACVHACPRASAPVCARVRVTIIRREQLYEEPTASDPFTLC